MKKERVSSGPFMDRYGEERVETFTNLTNRSVHQTEFLYQLVGQSLGRLVELEEKLKNNHCSFCPGTEEKVEEVLQMGYGSYWWRLENF